MMLELAVECSDPLFPAVVGWTAVTAISTAVRYWFLPVGKWPVHQRSKAADGCLVVREMDGAAVATVSGIRMGCSLWRWYRSTTNTFFSF